MQDTHSISAGLDYIGIGPILAYLHDLGRIRFAAATDRQVIDAFKITLRDEGIIPALESTHAIARVIEEAAQLAQDDKVLINLSGRGDKDIFTIADALEDDKWRDFIIKKATSYQQSN